MAQKENGGLIMLHLSVEKKRSNFHFRMNAHFRCEKITAIIGPSGAGKTTLLHLINGLLLPDKGTIKFGQKLLVDTQINKFIPPEKRRMATVFQDPLLFPHFTVLKNILYGQHSATDFRYEEIVDILNIRSLLNRYPATLSGGEKQRVSIARALLSNPRLLLMDEPLTGLDLPRKKELLNYIRCLSENFNVPILYVTHQLYEAHQLASELIILEQGDLHHYGAASALSTHEFFLSWL